MSDEAPQRLSDEELDAVEGAALMADHGGRRWLLRQNAKGYPQTVIRDSDVVLVAECFEGPEYPPVFADHITTSDPATVLRLIAELRDYRKDSSDVE